MTIRQIPIKTMEFSAGAALKEVAFTLTGNTVDLATIVVGGVGTNHVDTAVVRLNYQGVEFDARGDDFMSTTATLVQMRKGAGGAKVVAMTLANKLFQKKERNVVGPGFLQGTVDLTAGDVPVDPDDADGSYIVSLDEATAWPDEKIILKGVVATLMLTFSAKFTDVPCECPPGP